MKEGADRPPFDCAEMQKAASGGLFYDWTAREQAVPNADHDISIVELGFKRALYRNTTTNSDGSQHVTSSQADLYQG
jgi:hypothetical protein